MSDPDRTHYRENTQDYFSVSDRDSELTVSEAASPARRADTSLEEVLGGSGPENLFFDNLRLDPARRQEELARQRARENARRRLIGLDERAEDIVPVLEPVYANAHLDQAFMADGGDRGAAGGPPGEFPGAAEPPNLNVGPPPPPRGAGGPAVPPPGADAGGAGARAGNPPGQPAGAGAPAQHPVDYLRELVDGLARHAEYTVRIREAEARAINQMMANMMQANRDLVEGIQRVHLNQQQQNELGRNGRGGFGGRGGGAGRAPPRDPDEQRVPAKIDASFFPTFTLPKKESEYFDAHQMWCRKVNNILEANPGLEYLPMNSICAGILASLRGDAEVMCQHITGATYPTTEELLVAIGTATCGGAMQEKANNLFFSRGQRADEDIGRYCASLVMLFNRAYTVDQRSHYTFQRQFLIGLRDREVARMLIEREPPIAQNIPALRTAAVTLVERRNKVAQNEQQHKQLRQGRPAPQAATPTVRNHGEPMELGAVNKPGGGGKRGQVSNANAAGPARNAQSKPKNGSKAKPQSGSGGGQTRRTGECFGCGSKDHYRDKCPKEGKGVNATSPESEEVIFDDTWQAGADLNAACIGPLPINLNL